jgi:hypothetical protein
VFFARYQPRPIAMIAISMRRQWGCEIEREYAPTAPPATGKSRHPYKPVHRELSEQNDHP